MRKGPETRARYYKICCGYLQLWRAGNSTVRRWQSSAPTGARATTRRRLLRDNPVFKSLFQSDCLKKIVADCQPLKCDPQFEALVRGLINYCGESVAPEEQSYAPCPTVDGPGSPVRADSLLSSGGEVLSVRCEKLY